MIADGEAEMLAEALRTSISRVVRQTKQRADSLPQSRAEVLRQLQGEGPQTMRALAGARGVSHQNISRMISAMERDGLVERALNPADARGFLIAISPEGARALTRDRRARTLVIAAALSSMTDRDDERALRRLPEILDRIAAQLSAAPEGREDLPEVTV